MERDYHTHIGFVAFSDFEFSSYQADDDERYNKSGPIPAVLAPIVITHTSFAPNGI